MNYFEMKWRLSACRIQAGYSQAEVAEILGCSDKTIVSWETGKTAPKMEKAQELSDLYGIPLAFKTSTLLQLYDVQFCCIYNNLPYISEPTQTISLLF